MLTRLRSRLFGAARSAAPEVAELPHLVWRRKLANRYLTGRGLEVGALNSPLDVPRHCRVTYVDRFPLDQLRRCYPELTGTPLSRVDVVDDAEALGSFADESQDFVIANHFLEHAQDFIGTLSNFLRVLKPGGILYLGVPNRHETFDRDRPPTSWEHICRDHREGPEQSYDDHLHEWAVLVDKLHGVAAERRVAELREKQVSIHFHVWNEREFRHLLARTWAEFRLPFAIEYSGKPDFDILAILRKV